MCHSIEIDKDKKLAHVTASESVDVLELKEIFTEIIGHENWQAGFNMLCDYREIENFDVSTKDIDIITQWQKSIDTQIGNGRCAVVASKDDVYGMNRMWEILSSDLSYQISVFRNFDDAVSWLEYSVFNNL